MLLLAGFVIGLALVAPVGPVTLTLFGLGIEQGRRPALVGASAVVAVDFVYVPVALLGASVVGAVDPGLVRSLEAVLGLLLAGVAGAMVVGVEHARRVIGSVHRPGRTLAAVAAVNPLTLAAWLGLALALPASVHGATALTLFGAGLLGASALWHATLAIGAGWLGPRMGDRARTRMTRGSVLVLFAVAAALVL